MKLAKILIVDDVESIRSYLIEILKPLNATIFEAANGEQALQLATQEQFDLILMDIEMPGKSGISITKQLRKFPRYKQIPIIMITGLQKSELIEQAFDSGATDYISKPLSRVEVLSRIKIRIENREMEFELRQAKITAENASQEKSDFITRLAHELKTPLNGILGFSRFIQMDTNDKKILDNIAVVIEAAKLQEELINEVTNLAQIEAGIIEVNLTEIELSKVIMECFKLTRPLAEKFNVNLNLPNRSDVTYKLLADNTKLKQIFLNLLSNAIKYNNPNGEVNVLAETTDDGYIRVGVIDTGKGISAENIPKLFELFNRLGAEKLGIEGSGVGLPIAKKMIELMDGKLEVESTEGEGSTFWIYLKASKII